MNDDRPDLEVFQQCRDVPGGWRMPSFEDRFVSVGGIKTRYWRAGSEGPAVILLHGIGCSVHNWETNIPALAKCHRVYALDMLGY